jgi:DMSO/TMAO reductase YedYZ molybdopterin-dependent catalytic subunit
MRYAMIPAAVLFAAPLVAQQPGDSLLVEVVGQRVVLRSLAGLARDTVTATFHNAPARPYSGVHLRQILERAGFPPGRIRGRALAGYIAVEARDGYRVSFGVADLDTGLVAHRVVLADSVGGQPLPPDEGPWRLIVAGDAHGARSARMVSAIRLREP